MPTLFGTTLVMFVVLVTILRLAFVVMLVGLVMILRLAFAFASNVITNGNTPARIVFTLTNSQLYYLELVLVEGNNPLC